MEERGKSTIAESVKNNKSVAFWEPINPVNGSDEQVEKSIEEISKFFDFVRGKKKKLSNEEIEQFYNVYVYQELPYPLGTKNKNKFQNKRPPPLSWIKFTPILNSRHYHVLMTWI